MVKRVITDKVKMHKLDRLAIITDGNSSTTGCILASDVATGVDSAFVPSPIGACDLPRKGIEESPLTVFIKLTKRAKKRSHVVWTKFL